MPDAKRLARLHRVRTLQLGLAQADEARARDSAASEAALSRRIADLAAAVAPRPAQEAGGVALAAQAHFRERLHLSADAAANRVRQADAETERRAEQTRAARRDQSAIEKLMDRRRMEAIAAEMRALQDAPPPPRKNRHDPC